MGNKTVRVAVIETGHWHAGGYIKRAVDLGLKIVAVSDRSQETATGRADQLGCRAYSDYAELLAREAPDFVFAHGVHCEMTDIAEALVENGTPFVMEKPMGVEWRRLATVADEAERKGLFAGVDLPWRCSRLTRELLRLRDRGEMGRVTACSLRLLAGEPQRYRNWNVPWVLDLARAGGGPLFNFGPHLIDFLLLVSGQEVRNVFCQSSQALHGLDVEDYSSVVLSTADGAIASLEVGYVCPDSMYDTSVTVCTDRLFVSAKGVQAATISFRDGREMALGTEHGPPAMDYVEETLRRFEAGEPPVASVRDMSRALRVINAATESARTNAPVAFG